MKTKFAMTLPVIALSLAGIGAAPASAQAATPGTPAVASQQHAVRGTWPCPENNWCIYRDWNYQGGEIYTPGLVGDLQRGDWDKASSGINNTGSRVCLYNYLAPWDGGGKSLAAVMEPYQDVPFFRGANDVIDAYITIPGNQSCAGHVG